MCLHLFSGNILLHSPNTAQNLESSNGQQGEHKVEYHLQAIITKEEVSITKELRIHKSQTTYTNRNNFNFIQIFIICHIQYTFLSGLFILHINYYTHFRQYILPILKLDLIAQNCRPERKPFFYYRKFLLSALINIWHLKEKQQLNV